MRHLTLYNERKICYNIVEMKTDSVSKIKYLKIWEILNRETDEEHPMSTATLIDKLAKVGISCDRRTLYRNIEELNQFGYEILCNRGKSNEYYVLDRSFDLPELQILMDAVQAASFITEKKTPVLIDKIAQLAGAQKAEVLKHNIVQFGTVKGTNESIYYLVNEIAQAIINKHKIGFYYFDYDIKHQRKYRTRTNSPNEKRWYVVNPIATVFKDDKYYLFCYNDYHGNIVQYRVDKMDEVRMLDEVIVPSKAKSALDLVKHKKSLIGMFGGQTENVTFEGSITILDAIYDKFGDDINIREKEENLIEFSVEIQVSEPFFAWVCGFGEKLKVTAPQTVLDGIKEFLRQTMKNYL